MHISKEDKNPELYTETYDRWEDWMVGEVVCFNTCVGMRWAIVTKKRSEETLWAWVEEYKQSWLNLHKCSVKFKKRHTNKNSKVKVLAVKTVSIPTEIEFEGRVYVLKEGV